VEHEQEESAEGEVAEEVVEGVLVIAAPRRLAPVRQGPPPLRQVAAVAATGFVAGAATAAVLGRRMSRVAARRAANAATPSAPALLRRGPYEVVASRRYLVDVHTIVQR
jgi:hypothetical protein